MLWTAYPAEFGQGVYAILKGKVVEFMMTSNSVTLGRNSAAGQVDFDLSMEAPSFKISRRQVHNYKLYILWLVAIPLPSHQWLFQCVHTVLLQL